MTKSFLVTHSMHNAPLNLFLIFCDFFLPLLAIQGLVETCIPLTRMQPLAEIMTPSPCVFLITQHWALTIAGLQ